MKQKLPESSLTYFLGDKPIRKIVSNKNCKFFFIEKYKNVFFYIQFLKSGTKFNFFKGSYR